MQVVLTGFHLIVIIDLTRKLTKLEINDTLFRERSENIRKMREEQDRQVQESLLNDQNKVNIGLGFCDIQNNQGRGKSYQPKPRLITLIITSTLIILDSTKTSSNNNYCFIIH